MKLSPIQSKIVSTLGPATASLAQIRHLIQAGMNVARLNFAHGDHSEHGRLISYIRQASVQENKPVGILLDLPGPKLRAHILGGPSLTLKRGEMVVLTSQQKKRFGKRIFISYARLAQDLEPGHSVYISDGLVRLIVKSKTRQDVHCLVANGGVIRSGNGVNMPDSSLRLLAFTKEDEKHLEFGIKQKVDFIGISFVGHAQDVQRVRAFCRRRGFTPFFIAKIERQQALHNLNQILSEADGIMVARGDLGVEVPFPKLPGLQKDIITMAHKAAKPVIVATQVLESMIHNPRPTRAEATDIANAVLEGTDAIMLSGETSVGDFPIESVQALNAVIRSTEKRISNENETTQVDRPTLSDIIAHEACDIAERIKAKFIFVPSRSGGTASRVSRYRSSMPVIALIREKHLRLRFTLFRGIQSLAVTSLVRPSNAHVMIRRVGLKENLVKKGDHVVVVSGAPGLPIGQTGKIQVIKI